MILEYALVLVLSSGETKETGYTDNKGNCIDVAETLMQDRENKKALCLPTDGSEGFKTLRGGWSGRIYTVPENERTLDD